MTGARGFAREAKEHDLTGVGTGTVLERDAVRNEEEAGRQYCDGTEKDGTRDGQKAGTQPFRFSGCKAANRIHGQTF